MPLKLERLASSHVAHAIAHAALEVGVLLVFESDAVSDVRELHIDLLFFWFNVKTMTLYFL